MILLYIMFSKFQIIIFQLLLYNHYLCHSYHKKWIINDTITKMISKYFIKKIIDTYNLYSIIWYNIIIILYYISIKIIILLYKWFFFIFILFLSFIFIIFFYFLILIIFFFIFLLFIIFSLYFLFILSQML
jgi:hypothetical protein